MSQGAKLVIFWGLIVGTFVFAFVLLRILDAAQRPQTPPTTLRSIFKLAKKPPAAKRFQTISAWKGLTIAGLGVGVLLLLTGFWSKSNLERGSPTPHRVRHDDLVVQGADDNIHVTITDFRFAPGYVVEEDDGSWKKVWIPMQPARLLWGETVHRRVVVRTYNVRSKADLEEFYQREEVTGLIIEDREIDNGYRNELLRERNRGLDPSHVLILAEGEGFPTPVGVYFQLAMGTILLGLGVFSANRFASHARKSPEGIVAHVLDEVDNPDRKRSLLLDGVRANRNSSSPIVAGVHAEMYVVLVLAVGAALFSILWGVSTWRSFERLERGEIQILSVWGPAEFFYYRWGLDAAMIPFLALLIVSLGVIGWAVIAIQGFKESVGPATIRKAQVEVDRKQPEFNRLFEDDGRISLRTKILGGLLLLALLAQLIWALTL